MALSIEEVNKIVSKFAYKHKAFDNDKSRSMTNPISKRRVGMYQYPEYWDGYNFSAMMYDSILPHARADVYPEHLLSVRSPNQTEAQYEYIKANYKATTLNVFEDFKATISRAFADQNWSINVRPETDERFGEDTFSKFINEEIDKFGSVEVFVKSMLPTLKLIDPNGIIAIEPEDFDIEEDGSGEELLMGNNLIKPMPSYYNCKRIVGQEYGRWY